MVLLTVLILILMAVVVWGAFSFNRLVRLRNQVRTAWADIDVQLRRRHDLVPQLVERPDAIAFTQRATRSGTGRQRTVHQPCRQVPGLGHPREL